jgi:hypothetical protein
MKLILSLFLFSGLSFAYDERPSLVDYALELSNEEYYQVNPRLYRGEGEHQCQSLSSIGHTCRNLGVNFTDCNQAALKLKRDDCCSGSLYGGNSIGFKMVKCTNFN